MLNAFAHINTPEILLVIFAEVLCGIHKINVQSKLKFAIIRAN